MLPDPTEDMHIVHTEFTSSSGRGDCITVRVVISDRYRMSLLSYENKTDAMHQMIRDVQRHIMQEARLPYDVRLLQLQDYRVTDHSDTMMRFSHYMEAEMTFMVQRVDWSERIEMVADASLGLDELVVRPQRTELVRRNAPWFERKK